MALLQKRIKGANDILPGESYKWKVLQDVLMETASKFGFKEINIPVFENTELFNRGVGDTTDVVQKEMYTFKDKGDRSITLRPEFTAGVVRAALENGLLNEALPAKLCYFGKCYRYEKPQSGRYREFNQFGLEMLGSGSPYADAEVITIVSSIFDTLGVDSVSLELNSIGCPECRPKYHEALKNYFKGHYDDLCPTCQQRLETNPMRILDCKSEICKSIAKDAPVVTDYLCDDCKDHFSKVQSILESVGVEFKINPQIVRGLDYYTKTVFEFVSEDIGAKSTVCGGGRYDGLINQLGGKPTPALGFAMGIERLLILLKNNGIELPDEPVPTIYIAGMNEESSLLAFKLADMLRRDGFAALSDNMGRSLKAQMKYADKIGCRFTLVIGEDEIKNNKGTIKNMSTGDKTETTLDEGILDIIYKLDNDYATTELLNSIGNDSAAEKLKELLQ